MISYPLLASVRAALDQPVFPGKVIVWLLFMLSIIAWVLLLSKAGQLRRIKRSDRLFTDRLRKSKTTLEVFEEKWEDERSLKHLIYLAGAREVAYQLLGSREPQDHMRSRIRQAGRLAGRQIDFLQAAFQSGCRTAVGRLQSGIEGLSMVTVSALLLGAFGFLWTLMQGFDTASEFEKLAPIVGAALGHLVIALGVVIPALVGRLIIRSVVSRRELELERFRDDVQRLFERSFGSAADMGASPAPGRDAATAGELEEDKKRFHSVRDRLLRSEPEEGDPYEVNPIARQAATVGAKGGRGF